MTHEPTERESAAQVVAQATMDAARVVANAATEARQVVNTGGRVDIKSLAVWITLIAATAGSAVGYGRLQEKVAALDTKQVTGTVALERVDRRLQENEKAVAVMTAAVVEIRDLLRADRFRGRLHP